MQLYSTKNIYFYTFEIYIVDEYRIMNNVPNLIKLEYYYINIKL